jgi:predicted secreted Zn-dependent protease
VGRMKKIGYSYFFKKINNTVYKYFRIGNNDWEVIDTPYKHEPYIYMSGSKFPGYSKFEKLKEEVLNG